MIANEYRIAVVDRTLDLLEALGAVDGPVSSSDLARSLGATKSSVFRILVNLERRGYVVRDEVTGRYQLGARLVQLGHRAVESIDIRTSARPVLEALHGRFNETVNLGMLIDSNIVYLDMIESDHGLRMAARVGARDEVHSTALGKAILSFLPELEREQLLQPPLSRRTARTMTDPDALRAECARIRTSGVAEDHGENEDGARCFGAPIFDHRGAVVAAVSVSGPESRLAAEKARQVAEAVREAGQAISARIGGVVPNGAVGKEAVERQHNQV